MRVLVLGATGMLGQALMAEGRARGHDMKGTASLKQGLGRADYLFDITHENAITACLEDCKPDCIINTVAMTDLKACEENPDLAYQVNGRPAFWLSQNFERLIQISSDQCQGMLVNQYAKSKRDGEGFALENFNSLVVRTNIVGFRGHGKPTFAEWAMAAIEKDEPMTLFDDFYTSSIDVWSFSQILFDLMEKQPSVGGILNIASSQVSSKKEFIEALASRMGETLTNATVGSVAGIEPKRNHHCGLDVSRIEALLGRRMSDLNDVINALVERRNQPCINPLQSTAG